MLEIRPSAPLQPTIADPEPAAPASSASLASPAPSSGFAADPLANFGALNGFHAGVALYSAKGAPASNATAGRPPVYDVGSVTQAQIDAMKKSGDPVTRKIGITIENAKIAYADLLPKPDGKLDPSQRAAKILVTTSAGNGGEPVMVLTGPKFDDSKKARVITFYHGDNATVADPVGSKAGLNTRIRGAIDADPQTVFVLPEAKRQDGHAWKPGTDSPAARDANDYKADWGHVQSQSQTTDDALRARGITQVGTEIVAAHSRGGSAIARAIAHDPSGKGLRANELQLYDSLYGSQDQVAQWARTANGKAAGSVVFYRGTNRSDAGSPIAAAFHDRFVKIDVNGKLLGVPPNKPYKDDHGHTVPRDYPEVHQGRKTVRHDVVRDFHENPHYKTTGIFLGRNPGLNAI